MRHLFLSLLIIITLLISSNPPLETEHSLQEQSGSSEDNIVLNVLGNNLVGGFDWMTSSDPMELSGNKIYRQTYYAPAAKQGEGNQLYRLLRAQPFDHMDSLVPGEAQYTTEGPLTWLFNKPVPGSVALWRWYNQKTYDHLTTINTDPISKGYERESPQKGYVLPRYPNKGEILKKLKGKEVSLNANLVAGGSVWELHWGGKQFINDWDYGRQLQVAFYAQNDQEKCSKPEPPLDNPTEAGDRYGWPAKNQNGSSVVMERNPNLAHGSPLISLSIKKSKLSSSTWPLQWEPEKHGGDGLLGGENRPSMSKIRLSKEVEVDYLGRPHLIHWTSSVRLIKSSCVFVIELPTAYLDKQFSRMILFDPVKNAEQRITPPPTQSSGVFGIEQVNLGDGATGILATEDGKYALGIYYPKSLRTTFSPSGSGFAFYKFELGSWSTNERDRKYDADATKISLILRLLPPDSKRLDGRPPLLNGLHTWDTYLMVGSLMDVKEEARKLQQSGL